MSFLSKFIPRGLLSSAAKRETHEAALWASRSDAELHQQLLAMMKLYNFLSHEHQRVIIDFVRQFYTGKEVLVHPSVNDVEGALLAVAANAALVGSAQKTNCFSTVKWIYLCKDDLDVDGDAYASSTVRIDSDICIAESKYPRPGSNLIVHEFAHILDAQFGLSSSTEGLSKGFEQYIHDLQNGNWVPIADCFSDIDESDFSIFESGPAFHTDIEFFATVSEAFFTNAFELRRYHEPLYNDLSAIYGLDLAELNWEKIWEG